MALQATKHLLDLLKNDEGQDLIEYTLLIAFMCLASAVLISGSGAVSTNTIWRSANTVLGNAAMAAS